MFVFPVLYHLPSPNGFIPKDLFLIVLQSWAYRRFQARSKYEREHVVFVFLLLDDITKYIFSSPNSSYILILFFFTAEQYCSVYLFLWHFSCISIGSYASKFILLPRIVTKTAMDLDL